MSDKKRKKNFTSKDLLVTGEVLSKLGPATSKNIVKSRYKVSESVAPRSKENAYSKYNPAAKLSFEHGCDLLQYSIVVKPYIYKKFNLKHPIELDILLYLYPIQFFTRSDFALLPVAMYNYNFITLIDMGYLEKCVDHRIRKDVVWRLSDLSMKIVKEYYLYLSGEMKLAPNTPANPFRSKEKVKADTMRERIMMKLRAQAERNPGRFNKYY
jgi:hypothetical protein